MTPSATSLPSIAHHSPHPTDRQAINDTRAHRMPHGAQIEADGSIRFRVWAPTHETIALRLDNSPKPIPMTTLQEGGWHEINTREAAAGSLYQFVLPDGSRIPDPASRFHPQDVHGPSEE